MQIPLFSARLCLLPLLRVLLLSHAKHTVQLDQARTVVSLDHNERQIADLKQDRHDNATCPLPDHHAIQRRNREQNVDQLGNAGLLDQARKLMYHLTLQGLGRNQTREDPTHIGQLFLPAADADAIVKSALGFSRGKRKPLLPDPFIWQQSAQQKADHTAYKQIYKASQKIHLTPPKLLLLYSMRQKQVF